LGIALNFFSVLRREQCSMVEGLAPVCPVCRSARSYGGSAMLVLLLALALYNRRMSTAR